MKMKIKQVGWYENSWCAPGCLLIMSMFIKYHISNNSEKVNNAFLHTRRQNY